MLEKESQIEPDKIKDFENAEIAAYIKNEVEIERTPKTLSSFDDPEIDHAISEIEEKEADTSFAKSKNKSQFAKHNKNYFINYIGFKNKKKWLKIIGIIAIFLIILFLIPITRYHILNLIGVRASMRVKVIDQKNGQPLNGVSVSIGPISATTNANGEANLNNLKLGSANLLLTKQSFSPLDQKIVIGFGSNSIAVPFQMNAVGNKYTFIVLDWLSNKPIINADVNNGISIAISDSSGIATLQTDTKEEKFDVFIKANGYINQKLNVSSDNKSSIIVKLIPSMPDIFVSKKSGKYDLYKRDLDGKNETIIFAGTGYEQDDLQYLVSPDSSLVAFVSSRDNIRDSRRDLLNSLYLVDINKKSVQKIANSDSEKIKLLGWIGNKLIYLSSSYNNSDSNNSDSLISNQLFSYDTLQNKSITIAKSNTINIYEVINNQIYFAINTNNSEKGLYKINADGSNKIQLLDQVINLLIRPSFNKLQINTKDNKWYQQIIGDNKLNSLPEAPANLINHEFLVSQNGKNAAWIDNRDGKGELLLYDVNNQKESQILSQAGLNYPIRWLNDNYILLRIVNLLESADYVYNLNGGPLKKVGDVTNLY